MEQQSSYLSKLKFDPRLLLGLIAKYLVNLRVIALLTLAIIAFGVQSYNSLPRKLNPDINIPIVSVSTVLPGANPKDIESLITVPLEDEVRGVSNISTLTSTSTESVSIITIQFKSGVDPDKAKADTQSAVDKVTTLPTDAQKPSVQKFDFESQPIWVFDLAGQGEDRASLIRISRQLKKDLEDLTSIDKVDISGTDEQEIQIVLKPASIASYKLNPQQLMGAVKTSLSSFPAGNVVTDKSILSLTIDPAVTEVEDIRNLRIDLNGSITTMGAIADIKEISKPDQNQSFILNHNQVKPAVSFSVFRVNTVNFDAANADAQKLVSDELKTKGGRFEVLTVVNTADQIATQFSDLQRDITITVLLVFIILLTFLGIRQAIISMLSIPLTFLITFAVMNVTGIALSFLATFSLLLSLGLLVDDTIVIISAMTSYYRSGKFTPLQTALLVWKDFWVAILTTTITTVWAFLPLLLATGIIGEFIKPIPIIVSATLIASIGVALFITLPFMIFLLKPQIPQRVKVLLWVLALAILGFGVYSLLPKGVLLPVEFIAFLIFALIVYLIRIPLLAVIRKAFNARVSEKWNQRFSNALDNGFISFQRLDQAYLNLIYKILNSKSARRTTIIMVVIFSVFSYLLLPLGFVKSEFFPKTDEDNVYVSVELPAGTNLQSAQPESLKILDMIKDTPDTKYISLTQGQAYTGDQGGGASGGPNTFFYALALEEKGVRHETSSDIAQDLRKKLVNYTSGKVSVVEVSGGPPAGADLQIKLFGPDLQVLDQYANKIQDYLKTQKGVNNIDKTVKSGTSKLVFTPDQNKLAQSGLTTDTLGFWLRLYASGIKADDFKRSGDEDLTQDITIRLGSSDETIENISAISIPTQAGGNVPLMSLGTLELQTNPTLITREDGKRTISVTAGVTAGYNVADLNKNLENYAKSLNLTSGYGWATGGVNDENNKSVTSILEAMILSFLLIIITMVLQFNSFRRALIVMLVIPLSISGVFIIFALTQTPLSFPALIGMLALFGIVVKNSILVVDKILINQEAGMGFTESIADAGASRLEPIALTSVSAIVGLIPITLSDPLWRGLGGAIIAGLTFSGTIMLFFIPVVYYYVFAPRTPKRV